MEDYYSLNTMKEPAAAAPLSSQGTTTIDNYHDSPAEESGWTTYLVDFSKQRSEHSYGSSSFATSSLVSDAASRFHNGGAAAGFPHMPPKKLSLIKKMRTKQKISEEDPLEDTASSPVHSPQRLDMMSMKKTEDHTVGPLFGNGGSSYYHETSADERNGTVFAGENYEHTNLKKRGLCLVPLSLFSNYAG